MRLRLFYLVIPILAGAAALLLLVFAFNSGGPIQATLPGLDHSLSVSDEPFAILASRRISIPYGISAVHILDPEHLLVTGHGFCEENGESYRLRVTATQAPSGARATGTQEGACQETFTWEVTANVLGQKPFSPGSAEVCGHVVIHNRREGAISYKWCKLVDVQ